MFTLYRATNFFLVGWFLLVSENLMVRFFARLACSSWFALRLMGALGDQY